MKFSAAAFAAVALFSVESHAGKGKKKKGSYGFGSGFGRFGSKFGKGGDFCPSECIDEGRLSYSYSYHEEHDLYVNEGYLDCCLEWAFYAGVEYACTGLGGATMSITDESHTMFCCPNECADEVYNRRNCYGPFYWAPGSHAMRKVGKPPPMGCLPPPPPPKGKKGPVKVIKQPEEAPDEKQPDDPEGRRGLEVVEAAARDEDDERRLGCHCGVCPDDTDGSFCTLYMARKYRECGPWKEVVVASGPVNPPKPSSGRALESSSSMPALGCAMYVYCCRDEEATD